jgi:integrase
MGQRGTVIDEGVVLSWLETLDCKDKTKLAKMGHLRKLAVFLRAHGISLKLPEFHSRPSDYHPYVFSYEEIGMIFEYSDDLATIRRSSRRAAEFPMLLRLLYGCGLRLGEAMSLKWDDVDLNTGVLSITASKNLKDRLVPMNSELCRILTLYRSSPHFNGRKNSYLFQKSDGSHQDGKSYYGISNTMLCDLGIKGSRLPEGQSRGPCLHSFRHTFALHSLLKAEAEGWPFMQVVPFISTYLGHSGLMGTDVYFRAKHELYQNAHKTIEDYVQGVIPEVD